jgi:EAL domain-containing protein (putative c-di-GMP-specific phosphodiesterase class I)
LIRELNVLVVEDHDIEREMIVEHVRALNPKDVYSANDGQNALDLLSSSPVDVIISDFDAPSLDGLEFMRRLGEGGACRSVIIASAIPPALLTATEAMTRSYGVNLLGIVQKPVTSHALEMLLVRHAPPAGSVETASAPKRQHALEEIIDGLQQDQFEPFFQPKVEFATRRLVGAEALARWNHPLQGTVSPGAFVDTLEQTGNIDQLMSLMLRKGIAFSVALKAAGQESSLAVKLPVNSLGNEQLANQLNEIVCAQNIKPEHVCFEISESVVTGDAAAARENLAPLSSRGFVLSLDHFGTGKTSAHQLKRMPFSELKIDRSLVTNAGASEASKARLRSAIQMANDLNIKPWAEGVETHEDWDLLQELGCHGAQGFFIAKPMTAEAYLQWMSDLASDPTSIFVA